MILDDKLVAEARVVLGAPTLRALRETALREAVKVRYLELAPEHALPEEHLVPLLLEAASLKARGQV